jgi:hypothetical protein
MDTSSAESRDRLRRAIDDDIDSSEESTRALKSRRNALALISRLPPETLAAIFSFLSLPEWNKDVRYLEWIRVAHVCRQWRETALSHPRFWSHINFTKLKAPGVDEILARAKMAPLHLEADFTRWPCARPRVDATEKQVDAHIAHTRDLRICGPLRSALERLVSSAPTLEFLSLSHMSYPPGKAVIPVDIFNSTTPSLINLKLENCDISWKSPLLKGLRTLEIRGPSQAARPKLEDWLDALNEMSQLETLIFEFATPLAPLASLSSRIITLPSLTKFHISSSAKDCVLAFAHLVLPALIGLHVDAKSNGSYGTEGEDVRELIPYVTQNVYGLQDTEPLRSILIDGKTTHADVLAWTVPDADLKRSDPNVSVRASVPAHFKFAATGRNWDDGVHAAILDDFFSYLPVNSISTLTTQNKPELSKEFWVTHAPKWSLIERATLVPTTVKGFRDMLAEGAPPDGPRFPSLTKLTLVDIMLTVPRAYDLRDMILQRGEQGVPLHDLDLRTCVADVRAVGLLEEIVVEIQEPLKQHELTTTEVLAGDWHLQGPWDSDSDEDEDEDEDESESEGEYDHAGGI